jgi:hypothetical protein
MAMVITTGYAPIIFMMTNLLRAVLQPKAVEYLDTHGWAFDANGKVLNELSFRYEYDQRRRRLPGKLLSLIRTVLYWLTISLKQNQN